MTGLTWLAIHMAFAGEIVSTLMAVASVCLRSETGLQRLLRIISGIVSAVIVIGLWPMVFGT